MEAGRPIIFIEKVAYVKEVIMPKVSIIIPLYNKSKYISSTLDSVLQQKYTDYEVIVVNDGSTDDSLAIAKSYEIKDHRIHVLDISNGGVSHARNMGLSYAQGEWIQFLDGDDRIDEDYLVKGVELAEKYDVDILFTNFQMVDEDGRYKKEVVAPSQGLCTQNDLCQSFIEQQYENGYFGYISNKLIRRSTLERSKAEFPVGITLAEDLDFYAQIYPEVRKAYFAEINSFYYLQTDCNYLNNDKTDYFAQLLVQLDIRKWFVKSGEYVKYQRILDKKISEYVFFTLFHGKEDNQNVKVIYQKMINSDEIFDCIHPEYFHKFEKYLLQAVKKKNYIAILLLLNGRSAIRTIYRRIKNG